MTSTPHLHQGLHPAPRRSTWNRFATPTPPLPPAPAGCPPGPAPVHGRACPGRARPLPDGPGLPEKIRLPDPPGGRAARARGPSPGPCPGCSVHSGGHRPNGQARMVGRGSGRLPDLDRSALAALRARTGQVRAGTGQSTGQGRAYPAMRAGTGPSGQPGHAPGIADGMRLAGWLGRWPAGLGPGCRLAWAASALAPGPGGRWAGLTFVCRGAD